MYMYVAPPLSVEFQIMSRRVESSAAGAAGVPMEKVQFFTCTTQY